MTKKQIIDFLHKNIQTLIWTLVGSIILAVAYITFQPVDSQKNTWVHESNEDIDNSKWQTESPEDYIKQKKKKKAFQITKKEKKDDEEITSKVVPLDGIMTPSEDTIKKHRKGALVSRFADWKAMAIHDLINAEKEKGNQLKAASFARILEKTGAKDVAERIKVAELLKNNPELREEILQLAQRYKEDLKTQNRVLKNGKKRLKDMKSENYFLSWANSLISTMGFSEIKRAITNLGHSDSIHGTIYETLKKLYHHPFIRLCFKVICFLLGFKYFYDDFNKYKGKLMSCLITYLMHPSHIFNDAIESSIKQWTDWKNFTGEAWTDYQGDQKQSDSSIFEDHFLGQCFKICVIYIQEGWGKLLLLALIGVACWVALHFWSIESSYQQYIPILFIVLFIVGGYTTYSSSVNQTEFKNTYTAQLTLFVWIFLCNTTNFLLFFPKRIIGQGAILLTLVGFYSFFRGCISNFFYALQFQRLGNSSIRLGKAMKTIMDNDDLAPYTKSMNDFFDEPGEMRDLIETPLTENWLLEGFYALLQSFGDIGINSGKLYADNMIEEKKGEVWKDALADLIILIEIAETIEEAENEEDDDDNQEKSHITIPTRQEKNRRPKIKVYHTYNYNDKAKVEKAKKDKESKEEKPVLLRTHINTGSPITIIVGNKEITQKYLQTIGHTLGRLMATGTMQGEGHSSVSLPDKIFFIQETTAKEAHQQLMIAYCWAKQHPNKKVLIVASNPYSDYGQAEAAQIYTLSKALERLGNTTLFISTTNTGIYKLLDYERYTLLATAADKKGKSTGHLEHGKLTHLLSYDDLNNNTPNSIKKIFVENAQKNPSFIEGHDIGHLERNEYGYHIIFILLMLLLLLGLSLFYRNKFFQESTTMK